MSADAHAQFVDDERETSIIGALKPVGALLLGVALLQVGYGLQTTLVPLRADQEEFSRLVIGFLGSAYYVGFFAGCLFGPLIIIRCGHIRAFAALMAILSAALLAFPIVIGEMPWLMFRFFVGVCIAGLYIIVESWLNEKSTNATRGVVMSTYVVIGFAVIVVGQLSVTLMPLDSFGLFSIASIVISLAAVPVALTRATQPAAVPVVRFQPKKLFVNAPAAFAGTLVSGVLTGSVFSLAPIFAIDSGFSTDGAALFVSAIVLGGAFGQYPFGRVSDFVDRRLVLLVSTAGTVALSIVLVLGSAGDASPTTLLAMAFAFGFVMFPSYSLAVAHAFDWADRSEMVETSAGLLMLYGIGSAIGPLIASAAMGIVGPGALFFTLAGFATALAAFIAVRILRRRRPDEEQRSDFDLYSTAAVGGAITPDPVDVTDEGMELPNPVAAPAPLQPAAGSDYVTGAKDAPR